MSFPGVYTEHGLPADVLESRDGDGEGEVEAKEGEEEEGDWVEHNGIGIRGTLVVAVVVGDVVEEEQDR